MTLHICWKYKEYLTDREDIRTTISARLSHLLELYKLAEGLFCLSKAHTETKCIDVFGYENQRNRDVVKQVVEKANICEASLLLSNNVNVNVFNIERVHSWFNCRFLLLENSAVIFNGLPEMPESSVSKDTKMVPLNIAGYIKRSDSTFSAVNLLYILMLLKREFAKSLFVLGYWNGETIWVNNIKHYI